MSAWSDAVLAASPYLWWKLDETTGTVAADSSGNGNAGVYNAATLGQPSLIPGEPTGGSVLLSSTSANVQKNSGLSYSSVGVTYAQTFKSSTDFTVGRFFNAGTAYLSWQATYMVAVLGAAGTDQASLTYDPSNLCDGNPHLVVYVVRTATAELWVDGVMVASGSHSATPATMTQFQVKQAFSNPTGTFDDAVVWASALSSAQIETISAAWGGSEPGVPEVDAALAGSGAFSATTSATATTTTALSGSGEFTATSQAVGATVVAAHLSGSGEFTADAAVVEPPATTDTSNRVGGMRLSGYGIATWEPAVVATPPTLAEGHAVIAATAYGQRTMQGTQPVFSSVSNASAPRARQRIIVGGHDITYFRDVATPDVDYQLAEPLLYGPGTLTLPQVAAASEPLGEGDLSWLYLEAKVVVQRVLDGAVVGTDYKGFVAAFDTDGPDLRVELGGEAQGRASMMERPLPIVDVDSDLGRMGYFGINDLGLPFTPWRGPITGITLGRFGGMGQLDFIHEVVSRAWTKGEKQWTIMPGDDGRYTMFKKDTTTVHFTVFTDDKRNVASLRRDMAEEPNRIFATGVTPQGQRVRFGNYPGLRQADPAPYPFADGRSFGEGTTNEETDTGDGINVMLLRLDQTGYLSGADRILSPGFDRDASNAIEELQEDAGLLTTGRMNEPTWGALWDLDVTGRSLRHSRVMPAAQTTETRKWNRSASGGILGLNADYERSRIKVDRNVDYGAGQWRRQMRRYSRTLLASNGATNNWHGTVTIHTGAVLVGDVPEGTVVTDAEVMDARDIRPGMNARLPQFSGGILVHVSGVDVSGDGTVRLTVDTLARDAMKVWEVITRNRETRNSPARRWMGNRASSEVKDSIDIWDEIGGLLDGDVDLVEGWNVVPVVAGQEGTVGRIRLALDEPAEFAAAVFGGRVSEKRLNHLVPAPLTQTGTEAWEKRAISKTLDDLLRIVVWGTKDEPCGYSPGTKSGSAPLRGVHTEDAGFGYRCRIGAPFLYLAVWVPSANKLKGGRVMWPQLEAGA